MKMKSFLIPALALALAGCANEELETIGSGTIPAVPSGQTILFSNNTALTIGDADGVQTRAMEGSMELRENVNEACNLELHVTYQLHTMSLLHKRNPLEQSGME